MVSLWISTAQNGSRANPDAFVFRRFWRSGKAAAAAWSNIASTSSSIFQTSMPKVSKSCIQRQKTWPSWPCNWLYSNCMIDLYDLYGPFVSKSLRCLHVSPCVSVLAMPWRKEAASSRDIQHSLHAVDAFTVSISGCESELLLSSLMCPWYLWYSWAFDDFLWATLWFEDSNW